MDRNNLLLPAHPRPLLEVCARAETAFHLAREDERARPLPLIGACCAAVGFGNGQLVALGVVFGGDLVDLGAEVGEEGARQGVTCQGPVEREDADAACGRGGEVRDEDLWPGGGGVESGGGGAGEELERAGNTP